MQKATLQNPVKNPPSQRTGRSVSRRETSSGCAFGADSVVNRQVPFSAGRVAPPRDFAVTRMVYVVSGRRSRSGSM